MILESRLRQSCPLAISKWLMLLTGGGCRAKEASVRVSCDSGCDPSGRHACNLCTFPARPTGGCAGRVVCVLRMGCVQVALVLKHARHAAARARGSRAASSDTTCRGSPRPTVTRWRIGASAAWVAARCGPYPLHAWLGMLSHRLIPSRRIRAACSPARECPAIWAVQT